MLQCSDYTCSSNVDPDNEPVENSWSLLYLARQSLAFALTSCAPAAADLLACHSVAHAWVHVGSRIQFQYCEVYQR